MAAIRLPSADGLSSQALTRVGSLERDLWRQKFEGGLSQLLATELKKGYIGPSDNILDLGCGAGMVGRVLVSHNHKGMLYAHDVSEPMLVGDSSRWYHIGLHGSAEEAIDWFLRGVGTTAEITIDWVIAFGVTCHWTAGDFERILARITVLAARGVIISFDAITVQPNGHQVHQSDHRFGRFKPPPGWSKETVYSGSIGGDDPAQADATTEVVVLRRF